MKPWINLQWFMFTKGVETSIELDTSIASVSNENSSVNFVDGDAILDCAGENLLDEGGNLIFPEFSNRSYYGATNTSIAEATTANTNTQFVSDSEYSISEVYGSKPKIRFLTDFLIRDESGSAVLDELGNELIMEEYYA